MSKWTASQRRRWVTKATEEARRLGVTFGQAHPDTGMIWSGNQWSSPQSFERSRRGQLLRNARWRAREFNREFSLTSDDVDALWPADGRCPVFPHIQLSWGRENIGHSPSIDRVDSKRGYTPNNCRIISHRANMLKSDATDEELVLLADDAHRRLNGSAD